MKNADTPCHPKIFFFFSGAFVARENGAHWRAFSSLRFLLDSGFDVAVYSYRNDQIRPWQTSDEDLFAKVFPEASLYLDHQSQPLRLLAKIKKLVTGLLPGQASKIARLTLPGCSPAYHKLLKDGYVTPYINYATSALDINGIHLTDTIIDTHDILFVQLAKRSKHRIFAMRVVHKFRTEMSLLENSALAISIATADANLFRLCLNDHPVLFIANFPNVTLEKMRVPNAPNGRLLFVGSDNPFNVEGLVGFLNANQSLVELFGLDVAGKVSLHPALKAFDGLIPNLRLLGFVDNLDALYASVRAVISPVDGTGIKIKVLEALAAGVPVFASEHTIQGLPIGHEGCVFPIDGTMAEVLVDIPRLEQASVIARRWFDGLSETPDLKILVSELRRLTARSLIDKL